MEGYYRLPPNIGSSSFSGAKGSEIEGVPITIPFYLTGAAFFFCRERISGLLPLSIVGTCCPSDDCGVKVCSTMGSVVQLRPPSRSDPPASLKYNLNIIPKLYLFTILFKRHEDAPSSQTPLIQSGQQLNFRPATKSSRMSSTECVDTRCEKNFWPKDFCKPTSSQHQSSSFYLKREVPQEMILAR